MSNDSPGWLTPASSSQAGNWTASFTAASNIKLNTSIQQRTANVVVTGAASGTPFSQQFSIAQSGLQCTFTLPSTPFNIPAAGIPQSNPQSFQVQVSNAACQWTASSNSPKHPYIIGDGSMRTGTLTSTIQYWADPNTSTAKLPVFIQVGDQTYSGDQAGAITEDTFEASGTVTTSPAGVDLPLPITVHLDGEPQPLTATVDKNGAWKIGGLSAKVKYQVYLIFDNNHQDWISEFQE